MKTNEFIHHLDEAAIVAEIVRAEAGTSGEIRVFVAPGHVEAPVPEAERQFEKLGMTKTRCRNGVLLYFAPVSRKFAIIGDLGIHEKCGPAFWEELVAAIRPVLQAGNFTGAVTHAVSEAGRLLAHHFPAVTGDRNELPNQISRGED